MRRLNFVKSEENTNESAELLDRILLVVGLCGELMFSVGNKLSKNWQILIEIIYRQFNGSHRLSYVDVHVRTIATGAVVTIDTSHLADGHFNDWRKVESRKSRCCRIETGKTGVWLIVDMCDHLDLFAFSRWSHFYSSPMSHFSWWIHLRRKRR